MDKSATLYLLLEILKEETDENHFITQKELIEKLDKYGITMERKTISKYLNVLRDDLDFDIISQPKKGYALTKRELDPSQVTFLIDAIFSSKNFTGSQAKELVDVLEKFLSKHQRKKYNYISKSADLSRNKNQDFFYNIELLSEAIEKKIKIEFQCSDYDLDGKEILKYNGYKYPGTSPYYLVNNYGKYYLLCKLYNYNHISCFKVDHLRNITLLEDQPIDSKEDVIDIGKDFDIMQYLNEHIYIFGGKVSRCKIIIKNSRVISDIKDYFGSKAEFETKDGITTSNFTCNESAFFYWALQYGENIEVIEPIDVAIKLSNHYKSMYERYKDVLLTNDINPDLNSLFDNYINHQFQYDENKISDQKDFISYFANYLKQNVTHSYFIDYDEENIFIKSKENKPYLYKILFCDNKIEKNEFHCLENIKFIENHHKEYKNNLFVMIVKNKEYYQGEEDDALSTIFQKTRIVDNSLKYVLHENDVTLKYEYKLSWKSIRSTNKSKIRYKYTFFDRIKKG